MKALLIGMILAAASFAADVSGVWNGTFSYKQQDGSTGEPRQAFLELKQDGEKLTGKVGQSADQSFEINEGAIKDDLVTLTAAMPEGSLKITLKVKDGKLEGDLLMERGDEKRKATLKFSK